jgi:anti-sigma-K factor RskA
VNKESCGWLEEDTVDFLLGNMNEAKGSAYLRHQEQCERCASLYREWEPLMADRDARLIPSKELKRRLLQRYRWMTGIRSLFAKWRPLIFAPVAVLVVAILAFGGAFPQHIPITEPLRTAKDLPLNDVLLQQNAIVNHPRTVLHPVIPVRPASIRGYVWVNDESGEMFILAEGLEQSEEKDYQVWFVSGDHRSNAGVLQWRGRIAHLYFHGIEIRGVEDIVVSIEPKGGSVVPTGPDAMIVKLRYGQP